MQGIYFAVVITYASSVRVSSIFVILILIKDFLVS
jgi:hypothetical protein